MQFNLSILVSDLTVAHLNFKPHSEYTNVHNSLLR